MIHSDVFQRFVEDSPVCVMTQALLENVLSPTTVDSLFEQHAESSTPVTSSSPTSSTS